MVPPIPETKEQPDLLHYWRGPISATQFVSTLLHREPEDIPNYSGDVLSQFTRSISGVQVDSIESFRENLITTLSSTFHNKFAFCASTELVEVSSHSDPSSSRILVHQQPAFPSPAEPETSQPKPPAWGRDLAEPVMNLEILTELVEEKPRAKGKQSRRRASHILGAVRHPRIRSWLMHRIEHSMQHQNRIRVFLCLLIQAPGGERMASFLMADRSAVIMTEDLNLINPRDVNHFLKFFAALHENLAHNDVTAQVRCGFDPTIKPATEEEADYFKTWVHKQPNGSLARKIEIPRVLRIHGPRHRHEEYLCSSEPVVFSSDLFSPGLRCYIGKSTYGKLVIIKDGWMANGHGELEVDELDGGPHSRGRACAVDKFLIDDQTTVASDFAVTNPGREEAVRHAGGLQKRTHYRVIFQPHNMPEDVTRTWRNARELVTIFRDSIEGNLKVYERGTLHRNVTSSTICVSGGHGYLVDWDMGLPESHEGN